MQHVFGGRVREPRRVADRDPYQGCGRATQDAVEHERAGQVVARTIGEPVHRDARGIVGRQHHDAIRFDPTCGERVESGGERRPVGKQRREQWIAGCDFFEREHERVGGQSREVGVHRDGDRPIEPREPRATGLDPRPERRRGVVCCRACEPRIVGRTGAAQEAEAAGRARERARDRLQQADELGRLFERELPQPVGHCRDRVDHETREPQARSAAVVAGRAAASSRASRPGHRRYRSARPTRARRATLRSRPIPRRRASPNRRPRSRAG